MGDRELALREIGWASAAGTPGGHRWRCRKCSATRPMGYLVVPRVTAGERVRAEPFDAIELHVAVLLSDDPDDP